MAVIAVGVGACAQTAAVVELRCSMFMAVVPEMLRSHRFLVLAIAVDAGPQRLHWQQKQEENDEDAFQIRYQWPRKLCCLYAMAANHSCCFLAVAGH